MVRRGGTGRWGRRGGTGRWGRRGWTGKWGRRGEFRRLGFSFPPGHTNPH
jgi:hypothetical protein